MNMIYGNFKIFDDLVPNISDKVKQMGISNWDQFLKAEKIHGMSHQDKKKVDEKIIQYKEAIQRGDFSKFASIPPNLHWIFYPLLKEKGKVGYLDIETTGLQFFNDEITLIGIYDGKEYKNLILGRDLTEENVLRLIEPFDMFVTHYGLKFDIPFLKYKFPNINFDKLHFDVSFVARKLNIGKNLKEIEKKLQIWREKHIAHIEGHLPVTLWEEYQSGRDESLNILIQHNRSDVVNLVKIADVMYEKLKEKS